MNVSTTAPPLSVQWVKRDEGSWLARSFEATALSPPDSGFTDRIERLAEETNRLGEQRLWEGYATVRGERYSNQPPPFRRADQVRTQKQMGNLFTCLVQRRRPAVVVEFGTAFGVSGMYWLAGLELNDFGQLLTFEPNGAWATVAQGNLAAVGQRFRLVNGTFEERVEAELGSGDRIDVAFIDAIHTSAFVRPQFELVAHHLASDGLILFDDIDFSSEMQSCWNGIAREQNVVASASLAGRVGIVELSL
jgi:predicted O-methyltransferase YrrM